MKKKRKEKSPQLEKKISIQDVLRHQGKGISLREDAAPRWEHALRWETFQKCLKSWGWVCKDKRGPWVGAGVRSWGGGSSRLIWGRTQWERMLRPERQAGPWEEGATHHLLAVMLSSSRSIPTPCHRQSPPIRPKNHHSQIGICEHKHKWTTKSQQILGKPSKKENHQIEKLNKTVTKKSDESKEMANGATFSK